MQLALLFDMKLLLALLASCSFCDVVHSDVYADVAEFSTLLSKSFCDDLKIGGPRCADSEWTGIEDYVDSLDGDPGEATIPAGSLVESAGLIDPDCTLDVQLTRSRDGTVDAAWAGGTVVARQRRTPRRGLFPRRPPLLPALA